MGKKRIYVSDIAALVAAVDAFAGIENIANLDIAKIGSELVTSFTSANFYSDLIQIMATYGVTKVISKITAAVAGKKPSVTFGNTTIILG